MNRIREQLIYTKHRLKCAFKRKRTLKVQTEGKTNWKLALAINLLSDHVSVSMFTAFPPDQPSTLLLLQTWLLAPFVTHAEAPDSGTSTTVYHPLPDT